MRAILPGYKIEAIGTGLTFPTSATEDDARQCLCHQVRYSYGEVWDAQRLERLEPNGQFTMIAEGGKNGPWTSVYFHDGFFYVSESGKLEGGRILKISRSGEITTLFSSLPSMGDHHTNGAIVGPDGYIYFG